MPQNADVEARLDRVEVLVDELWNQFYILKMAINDLDTRNRVVEPNTQNIETAFRRLIDVLGGKALSKVDLARVLEPLSQPGELPDVSGAEDGLVGLESSENLTTVRPGGASKAVTYGGGSKSAPPGSLPIGTQDGSAGEPVLEQVIWLGQDVSTWSQTTKLTARTDPTSLYLDFTAAWTPQQIGASQVMGTAWIFVWRDSVYYAAPFSYVLQGQHSWSRGSVNGSQVNVFPIEDTWRPTPGIRYWFMVSGVAQGQVRNAQERSSLSSVVW